MPCMCHEESFFEDCASHFSRKKKGYSVMLGICLLFLLRSGKCTSKEDKSTSCHLVQTELIHWPFLIRDLPRDDW